MGSKELVRQPTLLELSQEVVEFLEAADSPAAEEALVEALATAGGALARKVDAYVSIKKEFEARAEVCKIEADRLRTVAKSCEQVVERLKVAARMAAERLGTDRLKGERGSITIVRVESDAIDILEEAKVPARFKDEIVIHKVNRQRLGAGIIVDEATQAVTDRETGEDLSLAIRVRPIVQVRFR